MTYRLEQDEHRRFCERLAQRVLQLASQRQHVHEQLVHFSIHYKTKKKKNTNKILFRVAK